MDISADTIVSNAIGAVVAVLVASAFHFWASRATRRDFTILTRFLDSFSRALLEGRDVQVGFTRDIKDRVVNASLTVSVKPVVMASSVGRVGALEVDTQNGDVVDEGGA